MKVALLKKAEIAKNSAKQNVVVRRMVALEDGEIRIFDGQHHDTIMVHEGDIGGRVQVDTVEFDENTWLDKDTTVLGDSKLKGFVAIGHNKIEDAEISENTVLAGRVKVRNAKIGKDVTIYGTVSVEGDSVVKDGASILGGTIVRHSTIGVKATVFSAGIIDHAEIADYEIKEHPLNHYRTTAAKVATIV